MAATTHRRDWDPRLLVGLAVGVVALAVGALVGATLLRGEAVSVTEQRDATAEQATTLAQQIRSECDAGRLTGPVCGTAAQVVAEPVPPMRGERGPGPTDEQIAAAVADYLTRHPPQEGRPPTTGEIAAVVASYMLAHPPDPGRPPTADEIAAAVAAYLADHPPADGDPGRPPTAEEIRAAVDAYLVDHPPPSGPQGVGVQSVRAEERSGQCVLVFVLVDPTDDSAREAVVDVPHGICDDGLLR